MLGRFLWATTPLILITACGLMSLSETAWAAEANTAAAKAPDWFRNWRLEEPLSAAEIVLLARVTNVSQLTVIQGAKTSTAIREYRFEPVARLKGIFSRDELAMTGSDLGCAFEDLTSPPPLAQGEFRLLILSQRSGQFGCVAPIRGSNFDQRVPKLSGLGDSLLKTIDTLVRVGEMRSRRERTEAIIARLHDASDAGDVPLLLSLQKRSLWAARANRVSQPLVRLAKSKSPVVQAEAIRTITLLLKSGEHELATSAKRAFAAALKEFLDLERQPTSLRTRAIQSLGLLGNAGRDLAWPGEYLAEQATDGRTYAERNAAVIALGQLQPPNAADVVLRLLAALPLDCAAKRELWYTQAAVQLDAERAADVLLERLEACLPRKHSVTTEIDTLVSLRAAKMMPMLLELAQDPAVSAEGKKRVARALAQSKDARAIPILRGWLRPDNRLRLTALSTLEQIDTVAAAQAVRSSLKTERALDNKLRMARLLGRHGMADGFSLAIEHLADKGRTLLAAQVLADIKDPRTQAQLSSILQQRPGRRWSAAALTGLLAIQDADATKELFDILADDRHPIILDAIKAVPLIESDQAIARLVKLSGSRSPNVARAAVDALGAYIDKQLAERELSRAEGELAASALTDLSLDSYVDVKTRLKAISVLGQFENEQARETFESLAEDASLEGSKIMRQVEEQLGRRPARAG